jgi:hypothetical protein
MAWRGDRSDLQGRRSCVQTQQTNEGDRTMSNVTRIALSAAIIIGTALSALSAANAGFTREQAASSGTGIAAYSGDGGIVSGNWR